MTDELFALRLLWPRLSVIPGASHTCRSDGAILGMRFPTSATLPHPSHTGFVIYARAVVQAVRYSCPLGPGRLIERGWDLHSSLCWAWFHPGLPHAVGWYEGGDFWMAQRLRRQRANPAPLTVVGTTTFGRPPDRLVVAPTVLDLPVEGPDLPAVDPPVSRQRVIPDEAVGADVRNILGVPSEFGITCTQKSTSHAPSYYASLSLGGPLLRTNEDGKRLARREVLPGDARNVSSFPLDIPWFIGHAACWLYRRVLALSCAMQVSASRTKTGNFRQLAVVYQAPASGDAGLYLELPSGGGVEQYVAVPGQVRGCTTRTFAQIAAKLDGRAG